MLNDEQRGAARDRRASSPTRWSRRSSPSTTSSTRSRTRSSARWARWACSGCRSRSRVRRHGRRLLRALRGASRSWPGSTPASRSRSRRRSRWAPCRSTGSAPRSRSSEWLPRLVTGEALAAFGLTEPGFGSDAGGAPTRAVLDESTDEWVINGSKAFITNSGTDITALVAVAAVTGRGRTAARSSPTILVPSGTPGLHRRARLLEGRLVRLGHPRAGLRRRAGCRRPTCSASAAAGSPSSCGPSTRGGSRSRRWPSAWPRAASTSRCATPGSARRSASPIGDFQAIQFKIADMEMRAHTARLA